MFLFDRTDLLVFPTLSSLITLSCLSSLSYSLCGYYLGPRVSRVPVLFPSPFLVILDHSLSVSPLCNILSILALTSNGLPENNLSSWWEDTTVCLIWTKIMKFIFIILFRSKLSIVIEERERETLRSQSQFQHTNCLLTREGSFSRPKLL